MTVILFILGFCVVLLSILAAFLQRHVFILLLVAAVMAYVVIHNRLLGN